MIDKGRNPDEVLSLCESYGKDFGARIGASAYRHRLFSLDFAFRCSLSEIERLCRLVREGNVSHDLALYMVWQVLQSEMSGLKKGHFRTLFQWLNKQRLVIRHPYRKRGWAYGTRMDAPLTKAGTTAEGLRKYLLSLDEKSFRRLLESIEESVWMYRIFQADIFEGLSPAQQANMLCFTIRANRPLQEKLMYFCDQLENRGFDPCGLLCRIDEGKFTRLFEYAWLPGWERLTDRPELFKVLSEEKRRIYLTYVGAREYPKCALETVMLGNYGSELSRLAYDGLRRIYLGKLFQTNPSIDELQALIRESSGYSELSIKCLLHGKTEDELFARAGLICLLHFERTDILKEMMERDRAKIEANYDITSFLEQII